MKPNSNNKNLLLKESTRRDFILHGLSFLKNLFLFQMMFSNVFSKTSIHLLNNVFFLEDINTDSKVKDFINANSSNEIVFTKGTTEGMNMIIFGFMKNIQSM